MFKRGVEYTRKEIASIARPEDPPKGGDWNTGYTTMIENNLFVFMNIGVPGRTGHDFENYYDEESQTLVWFSKPNKKSSNPLLKKLLSRELTPYFFARWEQRAPFTFLGTGIILDFKDDYVSPQGHTCVRFVVHVKELEDILPLPIRQMELPSHALQIQDADRKPGLSLFDGQQKEHSSFLFEKHLEDFLVTNWSKTPLAREYEIYDQQYRTGMGPVDILGQRKDKSKFLVVELKRDRASDVVVGQTLRYMGWIKEHLCEKNQDVAGCVIAQRKDEKLDYALKQVNNIEFMRYEVDFRLIR